MLIVSVTINNLIKQLPFRQLLLLLLLYESPLFGPEAPGRAKRFSVASMGSRRHDSHPSLLRLHKRNIPGYSTHICIPVIQSNYFLFTTFIYAKLGILPPTRCLRCATDGSA